MPRHFLFVPLLTPFLVMLFLRLAVADSAIFGLWLEPSMKAHVLLYPCEQELCGDLVKLPDDVEPRDTMNPDPAKAGRQLLGITLIERFRQVDLLGKVWIGGGEHGALPGRIYLPTNGDTLGDAENTYIIHLIDRDNLSIGIDNYLFTCLVKKNWVRVEGNLSGSAIK